MPRRSMKESCRAACVPDKPIKEWLREKVCRAPFPLD